MLEFELVFADRCLESLQSLVGLSLLLFGMLSHSCNGVYELTYFSLVVFPQVTVSTFHVLQLSLELRRYFFNDLGHPSINRSFEIHQVYL